MVWSVWQVRDLLAPGLWGVANKLGRDADIIVNPVSDSLHIRGDGLDFTISRKELEDNSFKEKFRNEMAVWSERAGFIFEKGGPKP